MSLKRLIMCLPGLNMDSKDERIIEEAGNRGSLTWPCRFREGRRREKAEVFSGNSSCPMKRTIIRRVFQAGSFYYRSRYRY